MTLSYKDQNENFELYVIGEREPVTLFSPECRDVGESRKMGSSVKYRLKELGEP